MDKNLAPLIEELRSIVQEVPTLTNDQLKGLEAILAANFLLELHDSKGEKALDHFLERFTKYIEREEEAVQLGTKPRLIPLLGYEKDAIRKFISVWTGDIYVPVHAPDSMTRRQLGARAFGSAATGLLAAAGCVDRAFAAQQERNTNKFYGWLLGLVGSTGAGAGGFMHYATSSIKAPSHEDREEARMLFRKFLSILGDTLKAVGMELESKGSSLGYGGV